MRVRNQKQVKSTRYDKDKYSQPGDAIFNFYEGRGFEPSLEEQQILLDL